MNLTRWKKGLRYGQSGRLANAFFFALVLSWQLSPALLYANPTGGEVVGGSASINAAGNTLTVNQGSQYAIINWQGFSISMGELTKFIQPGADSAVLNRVVGGNLSEIYGSLQANGRVYLINPNGVLIGSSGVINTAGFLASTLNVANDEFMAGGKLHFVGDSNASVVNKGTINSVRGNVYLIAAQVINEGTITASNGTAGLAGGHDVWLQQEGDERLFIGTGSNGSVSNMGAIHAAQVELKAAGGNAYALAINNGGTVRATGVANVGGKIILAANGGKILNSGTLAAKKANGDGGAIKVNAKDIEFTSGSSFDVDGEGTGSGGTADIIATDTLIFAGTGSARGGELGGDGGFAELSGYNQVLISGHVDLRANHGAWGSLLIDPGAVTIQSGPNAAIDFNTFNDGYVNAQLGLGNFTISTANATGGGTENITLNAGAALDWSAATILSLGAGNSIILNGTITATNGTLVLNAANAASSITADGAIYIKDFRLMQGQWSQLGALPAFTVLNNFALSNGVQFLRATGGTGATLDPYILMDVYGLQGMAYSPMTYSYQLGGNINASGTATWNSGAGFVSIGSAADAYTGTFNGATYSRRSTGRHRMMSACLVVVPGPSRM